MRDTCQGFSSQVGELRGTVADMFALAPHTVFELVHGGEVLTDKDNGRGLGDLAQI